MRLLVDTHIFLWFILEDDRLSQKLLNLLEADHDVFVSIASLWEIAIKSSLNKLKLPEPFHPFIQKQLQINDFEILDIKYEHLNLVSHLNFHHRDPFDRLLISQAIVEKIPLVSLDSQFSIQKVSASTYFLNFSHFNHKNYARHSNDRQPCQ